MLLICKYCGNEDAKGNLIQYLQSKKYRKPKTKDVFKLWERMEELMNFSDMLKGDQSNLNDEEEK